MLEKIKKTFQNRTSRNGSYSVGLIALVVGIVVVINLIAAQLPENIRKIDISDNKIYEISKTSKKILEKLDHKVTFKVFAEKDSADERIRTFLKKYAALSDQIKVEWVDPVLHPSALKDNNVEANTILISCKDTGKTTTVAFDKIIVVDEYSYYTTGSATESEFDGEGQLTSAIHYVTSDTQKKMYYTTGHGESTFSSSVSELLDKNNMSEEEVNLLMAGKVPDDCDLLFLYGPVKDITEEESTMLADYMSKGGRVFLILGDAKEDTPNLKKFLAEYGMEQADGYIADMQRCYQGNYYYIFPEISASGDMAEGLDTDMVLLSNAHGMNLTDPARDTISVTPFMSTSSNAYAVTQEAQKEGSYTLGAVATESISSDEGSDADKDESAEEESTSSSGGEEKQARLTVISAESLIDAQITDAFTTLENLNLFMNAVSANFDDVQNVAIEPKSLEVTYNTMQYAGLISLLLIFGIPFIILVYGLVKWWKRRKA